MADLPQLVRHQTKVKHNNTVICLNLSDTAFGQRTPHLRAPSSRPTPNTNGSTHLLDPKSVVSLLVEIKIQANIIKEDRKAPVDEKMRLRLHETALLVVGSYTHPFLKMQSLSH